MLIALCPYLVAYGGGVDTGQHLSIDLPYLSNNYVQQDVFLYSQHNSKQATLHISLYKYGPNDSLIIYSLDRQIKLKGGLNKIETKLFKEGKVLRYDPIFFEIIKVYESCPPGQYRYFLSAKNKDSLLYSGSTVFVVDSNLNVTSKLKHQLDKHLVSNNRISDHLLNGNMNTDKLNRLSDRLQTSIGKRKRLSLRPNYQNGFASVFIYYKGWFLGRYAVLSKEDVKNELKKEQRMLTSSAASLFNGNIVRSPGVLAQFKQLNRTKEQRKDKLNGELSVGTHFGNGQDPGSQQDNNYQEYAATVNTKILGVPVTLDGYYTSQDQYRQAKASYIRFHYDMEEAKSELGNTMGAYKTVYDQALNNEHSVKSVYQNYISKLENKKDNISRQFTDEYGLSLDEHIGSETSLDRYVDSLIDHTEDSSLAQKLLGQKDKLIKAYVTYQTLNKEVSKYQNMFDQYSESMLIDSMLVYDKIKKYGDGNYEDMSYKQMVRSAAGILPDGKAKSFFSGVTNLDLGIINQYHSKYTISGQTIKGGSIGYDFGIAKTSLVIGKTEYISRTGAVDRYNSILVGVDVTKVKQQEIGFKYYAYTPTKQVYQSEYFKYDIASPSFRSPVQIPSVNYRGVLFKDVTIYTEAAASFKRNAAEQTVNKDNAALTTTVDYEIKRIATNLTATYEHVGKNFDNSSLPYIRSATERYEVEAEKTFFRSFLKASVQFNYFKQQSFSSTGYSKKWGFDIATRSKRYPNVRVSYKPFSTFRTINDTFSIAQRPLVGEVWLANGSYQIKRQHTVHRFMVLYNKSSSEQDTVGYASSTTQFAYLLNKGKVFYNLNIGWYQLPVSYDQSWDKESYFFSNAISLSVLERLATSINQHISLSSGSIQRFALGLGCVYSLKKLPITLRSNLRYTHLSKDKSFEQRDLWVTDLILSWRFKIKNN